MLRYRVKERYGAELKKQEIKRYIAVNFTSIFISKNETDIPKNPLTNHAQTIALFSVKGRRTSMGGNKPKTIIGIAAK